MQKECPKTGLECATEPGECYYGACIKGNKDCSHPEAVTQINGKKPCLQCIPSPFNDFCRLPKEKVCPNLMYYSICYTKHYCYGMALDYVEEGPTAAKVVSAFRYGCYEAADKNFAEKELTESCVPGNKYAKHVFEWSAGQESQRDSHRLNDNFATGNIVDSVLCLCKSSHDCAMSQLEPCRHVSLEKGKPRVTGCKSPPDPIERLPILTAIRKHAYIRAMEGSNVPDVIRTPSEYKLLNYGINESQVNYDTYVQCSRRNWPRDTGAVNFLEHNWITNGTTYVLSGILVQAGFKFLSMIIFTCFFMLCLLPSRK